MQLETAQYEFLRRNTTVKWGSGVPTWDFFELVDGAWQVTTYEVSAVFENPTTRKFVLDDQPDEGYAA